MSTVPPEQLAAVRAACARLDAAAGRLRVEVLAAEVGLATSTFHRAFKAVTGVTPRQYAAAGERDRLSGALEAHEQVSDAVFASGFVASSRFYDRVQALLGMPPRIWQRGGEGLAIHFAVGQASLGAVLVACSPRGVVEIALGEAPEPLVEALQDRFPRAELVGDDPGFARLVAHVVGHVERPEAWEDLPLDVRGTAFQQGVWAALRRIPLGERRTYAEVAAAIGRPTAARAVARACATNTLALAIPCHRVVRSDGGLSGYRWGVARKAELLARESG